MNTAPDPVLVIDFDEARLRIAWSWITEQSYWAAGIPWETFSRSCAGSLCFGLVEDDELLAFARVVTDQATFAWLCDVFVSPRARGRGMGKQLMQHIMADPRLQGLRRWSLATADAHGLYAQYGFVPANPQSHMEKVDREVYRPLSSTT
jgi:GNAT superfamily N-acetyltransferase